MLQGFMANKVVEVRTERRPTILYTQNYRKYICEDVIITYSGLYSVYDRTGGEWKQIITNNIIKVNIKCF